MVKVYRFKAWDIIKDLYLVDDYAATREYIEARKPLQIIEESEIEVDPDKLDADGKIKL
jgi:hypothetical protein